jgi:hypothetical protein
MTDTDVPSHEAQWHLLPQLTPVALAAVVGAAGSIRDVEPCAQVSKLVEDAK